MKKQKLILFLALSTLIVVPLTARQSPQWVNDIVNKNAGLIDSIAQYADSKEAPEYSSYMIYYHRPLEDTRPGQPIGSGYRLYSKQINELF